MALKNSDIEQCVAKAVVMAHKLWEDDNSRACALVHIAGNLLLRAGKIKCLMDEGYDRGYVEDEIRAYMDEGYGE